MTKILSIDSASSSGIVILEGNKLTVTNLICPDFEEMYLAIENQGWLENLDQVLLEDWYYFGSGKRTKKENPITTRQVIKRIGMLEGIFKMYRYDVHMMHVMSVRSKLGIKGKAGDTKQVINKRVRELTGTILTTDITDALVMLLAHVGKTSLDAVLDYDFERIKNVKVTRKE